MSATSSHSVKISCGKQHVYSNQLVASVFYVCEATIDDIPMEVKVVICYSMTPHLIYRVLFGNKEVRKHPDIREIRLAFLAELGKKKSKMPVITNGISG